MVGATIIKEKVYTVLDYADNISLLTGMAEILILSLEAIAIRQIL